MTVVKIKLDNGEVWCIKKCDLVHIFNQVEDRHDGDDFTDKHLLDTAKACRSWEDLKQDEVMFIDPTPNDWPSYEIVR